MKKYYTEPSFEQIYKHETIIQNWNNVKKSLLIWATQLASGVFSKTPKHFEVTSKIFGFPRL